MSPHELQSAIVDFVNQPHYHPVKPRVIAQRLGLPKEEAPNVRRAVKLLVRRGKLEYASNHLVRPIKPSPPAPLPEGEGISWPSPPAPLPEGEGGLSRKRKRSEHARPRVVGIFQRTQKGFGFVRPSPTGSEEDGTRRKEAVGERQDVFVPAKYTLDAASGDLVAVEIRRVRHPEAGTALGPRGRVVEILERQTRQFVGTYFESEGSAFVQVDGTLFAQPVFVGDPGAKNARPDDKVVMEMIRFPSPLHDGEGVIIEVLGPQGKPGVNTLSIIREFGLPEEFAKDALDEARQEAARFDESLEGRLDLSGETVVTINPVDARDFDDAISLERLDNGHWRLGVHIANVSHFVRPRTALDREAHNRGTSVYLPDRVLPMLPELISNGLASLQPDKVRYTKSVFMEYTPEGVRTHTEFHSAAIKSAKRLTYEEYDAFLAGPAILPSPSGRGAGGEGVRGGKRVQPDLPSPSGRGAGGEGGDGKRAQPATSRLKSPHPHPLPTNLRSVPGEGTPALTPPVHDLLGRMHELAMLLRRRRIRHGRWCCPCPR